jgi:hypothetical protein
MFRYNYLGAAIVVLISLDSAQIAAQPARFPQGKSLRWWVACTEIPAFQEGPEPPSGNAPDVIEFGFSDNSYFYDGGHLYAGPVESDANWIRSASNLQGKAWKLSRHTGELSVTDKVAGATKIYACREASWGTETAF